MYILQKNNNYIYILYLYDWHLIDTSPGLRNLFGYADTNVAKVPYVLKLCNGFANSGERPDFIDWMNMDELTSTVTSKTKHIPLTIRVSTRVLWVIQFRYSMMLNGELRVTSGKLKWQWSCNVFLSWWFQPILKTLVKLDYFPRVGVKNGENKPYLKPPPGFPLNLGTFHCQEFTAGKICGTFLLKQSWLCMSGETPKKQPSLTNHPLPTAVLTEYQLVPEKT